MGVDILYNDNGKENLTYYSIIEFIAGDIEVKKGLCRN